MKISINTPCSASWNDMQAHAQGKFCLHCNKHVIDFTRMSDTEIIKVLQGAGSGACGRFKKSQLERSLYLASPPKQTTVYRKILAGLLLFVGGDYEATAQTGEPILNRPHTTTPTSTGTMKTNDGSLLKQLKGRVLDADSKEPIPFCSIVVQDSYLSTTSDKDGFFMLDIPKSFTEDTLELRFNHISYNMLIKRYETKHLPRYTTAFLLEEQEQLLMGDILYIEEPEPKKEKRKEK